MKDPRLLKYLGYAFLIAPLGNLLLSLLSHQDEAGLNSERAIELFANIPLEDWAWLFLLFLSGVLLLMRHKTAWLIAVLSLLTVVLLNVTSLLEGEGRTFFSAAQEVQVLFSIFASACAILILFYARYPYLDRRQGWLGPVAERYDLRTPVEIELGRWVSGESESLSSSGCRIRLPSGEPLPSGIRFLSIRFPEIGIHQIKAQVVGFDGPVVRLKFRDLTGKDRKILGQWMKSKVRVVTL